MAVVWHGKQQITRNALIVRLRGNNDADETDNGFSILLFYFK